MAVAAKSVLFVRPPAAAVFFRLFSVYLITAIVARHMPRVISRCDDEFLSMDCI
jgi:hypothetical protein